MLGDEAKRLKGKMITEQYRSEFVRNNLTIINQDNVFSINKNKEDTEDVKFITKRNDGRYQGRRQIKGHKIEVYGKTQLECSKNLNKEVKVLNAKLKRQQINKFNYKLKEYFLKWFEENKKPFVVESTQKEIMRVYNKLKPLHGMFLKDITKSQIILFLKKLPHNRTKEKVELYFKSCMTSAWHEGYIKLNPFGNIRLTPKKQAKKKAFSFKQQSKILQRIKGTNLYAPIMIYLLTGLRKNELDTQNLTSCISKEQNILKAQNLKGRNKVVRYKQIKLSDKLIKLIFKNIDAIKNMTPETIYRDFADVLKELKIKGSIVTLRHTYATNNFYLGTPELVISRQMGHSSSQITKDIYTDIDYALTKEKVLQLYPNFYPEF